MFMMFPQTSFISKSVHCVWSQLQHRIKSWNYVLEFQCSQNNTFENTRKVTISIELLEEIFKAQTLAMVYASAQGCIPATVQNSYFLEGNQIDSSKTEHYEPFILSFQWNILY